MFKIIYSKILKIAYSWKIQISWKYKSNFWLVHTVSLMYDLACIFQLKHDGNDDSLKHSYSYDFTILGTWKIDIEWRKLYKLKFDEIKRRLHHNQFFYQHPKKYIYLSSTKEGAAIFHQQGVRRIILYIPLFPACAWCWLTDWKWY